MEDFLGWLTALLDQLPDLWALAGARVRALQTLDIAAVLVDLAGMADERLRLGAVLTGGAIVVLWLVRLWVRRRHDRDPVWVQTTLHKAVQLLMTQLRGRATRPARVTQRTITRQLKRSRRAFTTERWDRLWAQWKQADREVDALVSLLRRDRSSRVRHEQYQHLETLRATLLQRTDEN
jgi:hypothetical protein